MRYNHPMQKSRFGWISSVALLTAVIAVSLLTLAGPGYRAGWFGLGTALQRMFTWGAYAGIAAAILGLLALMVSRGRARAVAAIALLLGAGAVTVPWRLQQAAQAVPPIHDITTDTVTPPRFVEAATLRQSLGVPNSLDYTDDVAEQQRAGYPDLQPLFLAVSAGRGLPPGDGAGDGARAGRCSRATKPATASRRPTPPVGSASRTMSRSACRQSRMAAAAWTCARCRASAAATSAPTPAASGSSSPTFRAGPEPRAAPAARYCSTSNIRENLIVSERSVALGAVREQVVESAAVVVDDEQAGVGRLQPAEAQVHRPDVGAVVVLHQRLDEDARS